MPQEIPPAALLETSDFGAILGGISAVIEQVTADS
jgi:hypothetical protein